MLNWIAIAGVIVGVVLTGLQLAGLIKWPWFWVVFPIWIIPALGFVFMVIVWTLVLIVRPKGGA